jgi:putative membrane protein
MPYSRYKPEELILRDWLARDRTVLANERTLLAYVRTTLMLWISAGTWIKVFGATVGNLIIGAVFGLLGLVSLVIGVWRFRIIKGHMDRLQPPEESQDPPAPRP